MIKVTDHINNDEIRNSDGTVNDENGLRILFESIGINQIYHDDVDDDLWDDVLEFLNSNSTDYHEFLCNEAGFDVSDLDGDILSELAFQVELKNKIKG